MSDIQEVLSLLKKTGQALGSLDQQLNNKRIDAEIYEKRLKDALDGLEKAKKEHEQLRERTEQSKQEWRENLIQIESEATLLKTEARFKLEEAEKFRRQAEAELQIAEDLRNKLQIQLDDAAKKKEQILAALR